MANIFKTTDTGNIVELLRQFALVIRQFFATKSEIPTSLPANGGNADYATSAGTSETANSVEWDNVANKPDSFTPSSHTHKKSEITDFPESLPASDVYDWAKAETKPSYSWSEIDSRPTNVSDFTNDAGYITDSDAKFGKYLPLSGGTVTGQLYLTGLEEGNLDVTDNTELLTSYASNDGFGDTNATGKVYRRDAIKVYNYIKGKLDSVYSAIGHTHTKSEIVDFPTSLPASDVYDWAKAETKPSYNFGEIGAGVATIGDGANRLMFRTNASFGSGMYYSTPENESMVFANVNPITSWIFANTDPTANTDWRTLTPSLQIKNGRVTVNKLISSGTDASYNLDVNGAANANELYENGVRVSVEGHTHPYLPLSGGNLSGTLKLAYINPLLNFNTSKNSSWGGSIGYENHANDSLTFSLTNQRSTFNFKSGHVFDSQGNWLDNTVTPDFRIGNSSSSGEASGAYAQIGGNIVWHAGNDGSGSGLDADTLDGKHVSDFVLKSDHAGDMYEADDAYSEYCRVKKVWQIDANPSSVGTFADELEVPVPSADVMNKLADCIKQTIDITLHVGETIIKSTYTWRQMHWLKQCSRKDCIVYTTKYAIIDSKFPSVKDSGGTTRMPPTTIEISVSFDQTTKTRHVQAAIENVYGRAYYILKK